MNIIYNPKFCNIIKYGYSPIYIFSHDFNTNAKFGIILVYQTTSLDLLYKYIF